MFFRFGWGPTASDELPAEGQGFETWLKALADGDQDGEIESGMYDDYKHSGIITSASGEYNIEFCETDNEHGSKNFALIYGKMVRTADQTVVAVINAQLLKRSSRGGLYAVADDESHELIQFVRFFCNDNGQLRKGLREAIDDPARVKAAGRGGLLFLDEVHVLR